MPTDPTRRNEDEYFARQDAELLAQLRARVGAARARRADDARRLACPLDGSALAERAHGGVSIDVCPSCGGVFLDAGELEILELLARGAADPA